MDIDIDFPSNFTPLSIFPQGTYASMEKNGKLLKHAVGIYLQPIPIDDITKLSAIPFKQAEKFGYMKIDFLTLTLLDNFTDKEEIRSLIKIDPDWSLLKDPNVITKLFQIRNHVDLVLQLQPQSVLDLADCIALIRPAGKRMLSAYLKDKINIRHVLYKPSIDGKYYFKKGHAIAYALSIVLQLHLIKGGLL
jgi:DNA polymerase III alpha subunit